MTTDRENPGPVRYHRMRAAWGRAPSASIRYRTWPEGR